MPEETKKEILKTGPSSHLPHRHAGVIKSKAQTRSQLVAGKRIWAITGVFIAAIALIIAGFVFYARQQSERMQAANQYKSQPLAEEARISLMEDTATPADYLIIPDSSGTVAVSASGPLILDANGNLSCPSCVTGVVPSATTLVEQITNNYTTVEAITNNYSSLEQITNNYVTNVYDTLSLSAGTGIAISEVNGEYTISTSGVANQSLSNLSNVAINTHLLPAVHNSTDVGSGVAAFRSGYYGTSVHTPAMDTLLAGQLTIGMSMATSVLLGADTIMAAGKSLTVNGAALFKNAANSTAAFQIQNSAGTALLNANTSQGTLSVGTYVPTITWAAAAVTRTNYATGSNPEGITTTDFNGDNKSDLVTANFGSNTMSVFTNTGTGTFAAKVDYATGSAPRAITNADFNGDLKTDVALTNDGSSTISVFMNNGNGTFAAKVDYVTGTKPSSITNADFNGDGKPDLAVTNQNSRTISVFMNNGNGTFAAKVDYDIFEDLPQSITSADFNGDGKADLATANSQSHVISVFINNGNGTFAARVSYATGTYPRAITSADFNADGKADIAVANQNSATVSILMNTGTGTFATKVDYVIGEGAPMAITSADFNGDGKADLGVANATMGEVLVFINNGGTFAPKTSYAAGMYPLGITSADFNSDGNADLAAANNSGNNMSVLLFGGAPIGTPVAQVASKLVVNASSTVVGHMIQGTAGQTADLLQIRNDMNTTLLSVGSTGNVTAAGTLNVTGLVTAANALTVGGSLNAYGVLSVSGALYASGTLNATSNALFKNSFNSTTAFQIQQANATTVFGVDTTNGRVGIGTAAPANKLSVNALTVADSTAQVAIGTSAVGNKGLIVQGVASQTADLLQAQSSTGAVLASISATGTLTVTSATISGNITINGHIVTGGAVPSIVADAAACTTPTVSVIGNDTSGTVTVTAGTGCLTTGSMATITFNTVFGSTPRIILSASNANAANLKLYNGSVTTTAFTLDTGTVPTDTTAYKITYWVVRSLTK